MARVGLCSRPERRRFRASAGESTQRRAIW